MAIDNKSPTTDEDEDMILGQDSETRGFNLLRTDNELYNDEKNVVYTVVSVRRVKLPHNGEDWEILEDGQVTLLLKGTRFTNPEKAYLRTVAGMKFLITEYKAGATSVVKFKNKLKDLL